MCAVKKRLRFIASQGKYETCIRIFLSDANRLTKFGLQVELLRKSGNKAGIFHVSWKNPNGAFASELKELADKAA